MPEPALDAIKKRGISIAGIARYVRRPAPHIHMMLRGGLVATDDVRTVLVQLFAVPECDLFRTDRFGDPWTPRTRAVARAVFGVDRCACTEDEA